MYTSSIIGMWIIYRSYDALKSFVFIPFVFALKAWKKCIQRWLIVNPFHMYRCFWMPKELKGKRYRVLTTLTSQLSNIGSHTHTHWLDFVASNCKPIISTTSEFSFPRVLVFTAIGSEYFIRRFINVMLRASGATYFAIFLFFKFNLHINLFGCEIQFP